MNYDLIIIGGGIAGLSAAFYGQQRGLNFLLLESSGRLGGCIHSELLDEQFVVERGPNSLSLGVTLNEIIDELGLSKLITSKRATKKLVFAKDKLHEVSNPFYLFGSDFLSGASKGTLLSEVFRKSVPASPFEESVATFFERKFNREIVELLIWPILNGIYAGNPENLSLQSVFPAMYEAERKHKTLIGGLLKESFSSTLRKKTKVAKKIFSFENGLSTLVEALHQKLKEKIKLNAGVKSITQNGDTNFEITLLNGEVLRAKKVISAIPAYSNEALNINLFEGLKKINYAPVVTLMVWAKTFKSAQNKMNELFESSFGFLTSRNQKIKLLGAVFNSALFDGRAPQNIHALNCFLGGVQQPEHINLTDEDLSQVCINDLVKVSGCPPENFEVKMLTRWPKAIPQYEIGHKQLIESVLAKLPQSLKLAGNYLNGVSLEDTAKSGKQAVDELFPLLEEE